MALNPTSSRPSGGGSQTVEVATAHVTSAQLKNLLGAPITLVAAPGAGKVLIPVAWFTRYVFVTTDYSNWNGSDAAPWITLGNLAQVDLGGGPATVNCGNITTAGQPPDPATLPGWVFETSYANAAVKLENFGSQDLVDGDSTLTVVTYYATLTLS